MILISKYLGINGLEELGVFDALIDKDSNFFINILRLKETKTPEFSSSYERVNNFFSTIATLLSTATAKSISDKFFRAAFKKFDFKEVNGINLGFSKSGIGSGIGEKLRFQILGDAFDIVKQGSTQPEIFQLVGLFEENIGPDRLSDMIATIIKKDIIAYSKRVHKDLEINASHYPKEKFDKNGILYNPYKKCQFLFLPLDILHELPIAQSWEDIDRVISENQSIRDEINEAVGEEWSKWATRKKKNFIKEEIFKNPEKCSRVINKYRTETAEVFDPNRDVDYFVAKLWDKITNIENLLECKIKEKPNSFSLSIDIINFFKKWIENNRGWEVINSVESKKREKIVQRIIHLAGKSFIEANDLDFSCEPDEGRGPVDFKISRGADKTIIELKLSTNQQYLHGYEVQVEEYAKAENTNQMIYVLLDLGNPIRVKNLKKLHSQNIANGINVPEVIIINGTEKASASVFDFSDLEMNIDWDVPNLE